MAESLAKEALSLLQQVSKHKWTFRHVHEMTRSSYFAATIARQMGRLTEAEGLLQSSLDCCKELRGNKDSCMRPGSILRVRECI